MSLGISGQIQTEKKSYAFLAMFFLCEGDNKIPIAKTMTNTKTWLPVSPVAQFSRRFRRVLTSLTGVGFKMVCGLSFFLYSRVLSILRADSVLEPKEWVRWC